MRMWSGIWPPSKPPIATPDRAVWPLPPRPPVLPTPEPMPRPTRTRFLLAPGLSRSSFKRAISQSLLTIADDADEVRDLVDHAAHFGRVFQRPLLADLVEAEADQGRPLVGLTARGGSDLLDRYLLVSHFELPGLRLRPIPDRDGPGDRTPRGRGGPRRSASCRPA